MKIHKDTTIKISVSVSALLLLASVVTFIIFNVSAHIEQDIQSGTSWFTKDAVQELQRMAISQFAGAKIDSTDPAGFFEQNSRELDRRFESVLSRYENMQGGLYVKKGSKMYSVRFSKVTRLSEPDILPLFREKISEINESGLSSAGTIHKVVDEHNTVFHISVAPVISKGDNACSVWAVMRIEQMLPAAKLNQVFLVLGSLSAIGIVIAIIISYILRMRVEEVRLGLIELRKDPSFRLRKRGGVLGSIVESINETATLREKSDAERENLWLELGKKEKLAALGKLLAGVAHEIKTPLAIMKTRVQLWKRKLDSGTDPAEVVTSASMDQLITEVDKLSGILKKLLLFSRARMSDLATVNTKVAINKVAEFVSTRLDEAGVSLEIDLQEDIPNVIADAVGLEHILIDLITNAVESMPAGGAIRIEGGHDSACPEMAVIRVIDNGPGIPVDIREKVFDPFFTTKETGTGLGLSIAFEIASAFGGDISLDHDRVEGTAFILRLRSGKTANEKNTDS